jgi:UDP-N-acetylmuramoylalanine-D-glutamate ligase
MTLEDRGADDALELSRFQLDTLYELNQELSTLRNVREVLESSLL